MATVWKIITQFWDFLWNDDSLLSWVLNVVVAFLLIKFLIYPGLGVLFGTQFPIVAVVSGSMEHDGTFDDWWNSPAQCPQKCSQAQFYQQFKIDKQEFQSFDYPDGFNTGDIMVLVGTPPEKLQLGEILVFFSARGEPIIHRIIKINEVDSQFTFQTKGDHNVQSIESPGLNEVNIPERVIVGKAVLRIPYLGYVKIIFFNVVSTVGDFVRGIL